MIDEHGALHLVLPAARDRVRSIGSPGPGLPAQLRIEITPAEEAALLAAFKEKIIHDW